MRWIVAGLLALYLLDLTAGYLVADNLAIAMAPLIDSLHAITNALR